MTMAKKKNRVVSDTAVIETPTGETKAELTNDQAAQLQLRVASACGCSTGVAADRIAKLTAAELENIVNLNASREHDVARKIRDVIADSINTIAANKNKND